MGRTVKSTCFSLLVALCFWLIRTVKFRCRASDYKVCVKYVYMGQASSMVTKTVHSVVDDNKTRNISNKNDC